MAEVPCNVEEIEMPGYAGPDVDSVRVTCGKCGNKIEAFGTSEDSVRRCLSRLREECSEGEENEYVVE